MLLICQAKQMWRGDSIYFHNLKQIWPAAFPFSGACSCRKPGSPAACSRNIYSSPIELFFLQEELVSAGCGDPDSQVGEWELPWELFETQEMEQCGSQEWAQLRHSIHGSLCLPGYGVLAEDVRGIWRVTLEEIPGHEVCTWHPRRTQDLHPQCRFARELRCHSLFYI